MSLGTEYKLNRFDDPNYKETGLALFNAEPIVDTTMIKQPGTSQRRLIILEGGSKTIGLTLQAAIRRFADYIEPYCIVTAEGALPAHELRYTDGQDLKKLTGPVCDSIEVRTRVDAIIEARIRILCKTLDVFTSPDWQFYTEEPMIYKDVSTVKIGAATITNWEELVWRCNNNVISKCLGNVDTPAIVKARHPEYFGSILLSRAAASKLGDIYAGYVADAIYEYTDNQSPTPHVTEFKFVNAEWKSSTVRVPNTDIEWEYLTWEAKKVVIT